RCTAAVAFDLWPIRHFALAAQVVAPHHDDRTDSAGHEPASAGRGDGMSERDGGARPHRDRPWIFRTYAGHSTAAESNRLYRTNLARGQTGLSVAFDLPTQTGYDPDHVLARGEVGKVGVSIAHIGDMRTLFDGIPLAEMN